MEKIVAFILFVVMLFTIGGVLTAYDMSHAENVIYIEVDGELFVECEHSFPIFYDSLESFEELHIFIDGDELFVFDNGETLALLNADNSIYCYWN